MMTTREYNISVDEYSDDIYRFILKNLRDAERSKDIVQDAYVKLWTRATEVSFEKVKSYLFTTAYRLMIDHIRRLKVELDFTATKSVGMHEPEEFFDVKKILDEAANKLPEIQKSVLMLRDYEGYSYNEIGRICDLTESQVKVYIYRARLAMKNYIGSLERVL